MNAASLLAAETRAEWLKAWRQPAFAVPTLALPLAFYALFAIVLTRPGSGNAAYLLATYGVFAALGPALFAFGAGVAQEREAGQLALKQIAPLPVPLYLGAKLIVCMGFTALVVAGLYALAAWGAGVVLPRAAWAALAAVHVGAALPTGLLGLVIGLRLSGQAAMAFLFPPWMQVLALAMPSHHLAEIALAASGRDIGGSLPGHAAAVAGFMLVFAAGAGWAWRRAAR
ncbi:ABC transporter permease [Rubrivivax gelatinosus]|uniref:ABC transporter permease n=1 Tax=Rubrivivax gelatinosus TaxID=28068 RepID=UPI0003064768|nr:ABC transporter permease [Rubrivivax gelatinosus]